ncbi:MAG TPA: laccase domain-containing protein, partial [Candidatus Acidoferrales bacterium]|nr:laccase domain-containing protein [Candidatus Acidoferrales bacterium]
MTPFRARSIDKRARGKRDAASPPATKNENRDWSFHRSAGISVIQSAALKKEDWLVHGFSTRSGGLSTLPPAPGSHKLAGGVLNLGFAEWDQRARVEENRRRFMKAFGAAHFQMVALRQFHSDVIYVVDAAPATPLRGDAMVTRVPGLLLAVQTADCIPILLADPHARAVAAIHAGWRGTLKRIAEKTVGRMRMIFG